MLWTIAVILVVLWALGMVTSYTMTGFVHILLVLAVVAVLIRCAASSDTLSFLQPRAGDSADSPGLLN
jgi:hypothetical protein